MLSGELLGRLVRAMVRRRSLVLGLVAALAVAGAGAALTLRPSTAVETLVDRDSPAFRATEDAKRVFGDDAVVILVEGDLQSSLLTPDLGRLRDLEDCIAASPRSEELVERPAVCAELAELRPAKVVYGPGTFISRAADELTRSFEERVAERDRTAREQAATARRLAEREGLPPDEQERLADAARQVVEGSFQRELLGLALKYQLTSPPALNSPQFVSQLVFGQSEGGSEPKARFAYLFPSRDAALIQARLRPDLTDAERARAVELIRQAAGEERFAPQRGARLVVTGIPVVVEALAAAVQRSLAVLLVAAVLVMAATLALVFRSRFRLLPLGLALAAAAMTFGALALAGGTLTMASVAALPVLIGLAVDYAIQFQSRFDESLSAGAAPADAAPAAAAAGAPTIVVAGSATAVGFLALLLSPVPMVRGFGLIVVLGVVLALAIALCAGFAALVRLWDPPGRAGAPPLLPRTRGLAADVATAAPVAWLARRLRLTAAILGSLANAGGERLGDRLRAAARGALARPRRVLAAGLLLAALGWAADTQVRVVSDVRELVPQGLGALQDLDALQGATGVSGEIDVTVRASDLTDPAALRWMTSFQQDVLAAHGYAPGERCSQGAGAPELCPALSLPDLFGPAGAGSRSDVRALLDAVPPYFQQAVISPDRRVANLAFGIRLMPLDRQHEVIEDIRARLDPPPGVSAQVTGVPVLAADGNALLAAPLRRLAVLGAGLGAVFLALLAFGRSLRWAVAPLVPIALATGWAALALFLLRIPLNPMSAALGAVVIAISTEFSVLISYRYREERARGVPPQVAVERAYVSTGAAVLASGATATAGFAVLLASDIRMLRDFGAVTVVGLAVSLAGVIVALPAVLAWAERRGPLRLRARSPLRALAARRGSRA